MRLLHDVEQESFRQQRYFVPAASKSMPLLHDVEQEPARKQRQHAIRVKSIAI